MLQVVAARNHLPNVVMVERVEMDALGLTFADQQRQKLIELVAAGELIVPVGGDEQNRGLDRGSRAR